MTVTPEPMSIFIIVGTLFSIIWSNMSGSVRCDIIQALIVLNVKFMLYHSLVDISTAQFMFHKVNFICCMTCTCEMIFASAFVTFSSP